MQILRRVLMLLSCALVAVSAAEKPALKTISAKVFTFMAPADLQPVAARGVDSLVGQYTNATTDVSFDYGWFSDPLLTDGKEPAGYSKERVEVDGKSAAIVTCSKPTASRLPYSTGIHFPDLGDGRLKLTVYATCASTNQFPALKALFKSIRFEKRDAPPTRSSK